MKRSVLLTCAILISCAVFAQGDYYVFLQSENKQPFFVRVHEKRYDAAANGVLSIPGFSPGTCTLRIGFPGQVSGEKMFNLEIRQSDLGLQLRKNDLGQWALYDWKARQWISPQDTGRHDAVTDTALVETVKRKDAFANLMAAVVNDSSMLYTTVERKIERPVLADSGYVISKAPMPGAAAVQDSIRVDSPAKGGEGVSGKEMDRPVGHVPIRTKPGMPVTDSTAVAGSSRRPEEDSVSEKTAMNAPHADSTIVATQKAAISDSAINRTAPDSSVVHNSRPSDSASVVKGVSGKRNLSTVRKLLDNNLKTGKQQWYEVSNPDGSKDSVRITIPSADEAQMLSEAAPVVTVASDSGKVAAGGVKTDTVAAKPAPDLVKKNTLLQSDTLGRQPLAVMPAPDTAASQAAEDTAMAGGGLVMVNSDCHDFASDLDVDKLRIRMMEVGTADDRLDMARRVFRTKCFTTRQVRGLSELFPTDEGKYRFFDLAYPFVSDTDHFKSLIDLLSDVYYVNRFKAMVRL